MVKKDYYEILEISKNATKEDIKKAYRKLAHQHHPDKKGGNEAKFKEANEAYQILGDDQKRAQYDRFGTGFNDNAGGFGNGQGFSSNSQGFDFNFGGDFGGFSSQGGPWEDIFGEMFGGSGKKRARRGQDIKMDLEFDLEDSVSGKDIEVSFKKLSLCDECRGKGGFDPENCARCGGSGQVRQTFNSVFGTMSQIVSCQKCHGQGKSFKKICSECHGQGRAKKKTSFKMKIPKGILDGEIIKFSGEGEAGDQGAPSGPPTEAGDLFVQAHFKPHKDFRHEGANIHYNLIIDMTRAALGDKIEIPTLYGDVKLKIDPGAQPDDVIRISGKGLPKRGSWGGHGDMYVKIKVEIPKQLTKKQRELLEEIQKEGLK